MLGKIKGKIRAAVKAGERFIREDKSLCYAFGFGCLVGFFGAVIFA